MIIKPKIRGFICTTTHPKGCEHNVLEQIKYVSDQNNDFGNAKKVLIIGASTGYGLASRITSAFGNKASTIGVFLEKEPTTKKTGSAGWYNSHYFEEQAHKQGLYAKSINGDAFADETRAKTIELIKEDLGQIDLVIYSLASPVRKMPQTGEIVRSCLKPIDKNYTSPAINTNNDTVSTHTIEPATTEEIENTVKVMGGEDWELWIDALQKANVLADGCKTVAYSYIGSQITWDIYWNGTIGQAKKHLDKTAMQLNQKLAKIDGTANIAVLKSVVTQASSAIPVMPLYMSIAFKLMQENGTHEDCIEQIHRLFDTKLYAKNQTNITDEENRFRLDDLELKAEIQEKCNELMPKITTETLFEKTDYQLYKNSFLKLFGFGIEEIDYEQDIDPIVDFKTN